MLWQGLSNDLSDVGMNDAEYNGAQPTNPVVDVPKPTKVTYLDFDNPFSLIDQASGAPHVSRLSSYAWVGCGKDTYVLDCLTEGFIRIDSKMSSNGAIFCVRDFSFVTLHTVAYEAHFTPLLRAGDSRTVFTRKCKILTADTLGAAIRGCDTYAQKIVLPDNRALQYVKVA